MAQQLRVLTALVEDLSLGPNTNIGELTVACNSNPQDPTPYSGLHTHAHSSICTDIDINFKILLKFLLEDKNSRFFLQILCIRMFKVFQLFDQLKKIKLRYWRDSLMVFFQHPRGGLEPSVIPVPRVPAIALRCLCGYQTYTWYIGKHVGKHMHMEEWKAKRNNFLIQIKSQGK